MKDTTENELAKEKSELEKLTTLLEEKEHGFEELNRTLEQFKLKNSLNLTGLMQSLMNYWS